MIPGYRINWGSIFCGAFMTWSLLLLGFFLGGAVGLPSADIIDPMATGDFSAYSPEAGMYIWGWLYYLLLFVGSFLAGGFTVSKISQINGTLWGALYGVASWSVSIVLAVVVGSLYIPVLQELVGGIAPVSARWLMFCACGLGIFFSAWGGAAGTISRKHKVEPSQKAEVKPELKPEVKTDQKKDHIQIAS